MSTAGFYVEQAKLLFLWAGAATDPVVKEQLRRRAHEYLLMADAIEAGGPPAGAERSAPVVQQQQQIQPKEEC